MEAFINGIGVISPQKTFTGEEFLKDAPEYKGIQYLKCIEPSYNDFLDPMAARRMSRMVKMGVCAALKCLRDAGIENPDAIITGTGLGCIEDTEKFLNTLYANDEKLLNPTPFIQSTHNTVAAAIALRLKCNSYNNTYVHRGFSFENALLDGLMLFQEGSAANILVGGLDELTSNSFTITNRLGFWKKQPVDNLRLFDDKSKGSLAGEGIAFFVLSQQKTEKTVTALKSVGTFYKPENIAETEQKLSSFVQKTVGGFGNIDLILLGRNGDPSGDEIYDSLKSRLFSQVPCAFFKHLCGEYDTSSSFALYLASMILKEQKVPDVLLSGNKTNREIQNVLVYNHLRNVNHSMFLISSC